MIFNTGASSLWINTINEKCMDIVNSRQQTTGGDSAKCVAIFAFFDTLHLDANCSKWEASKQQLLYSSAFYELCSQVNLIYKI